MNFFTPVIPYLTTTYDCFDFFLKFFLEFRRLSRRRRIGGEITEKKEAFSIFLFKPLSIFHLKNSPATPIAIDPHYA